MCDWESIFLDYMSELAKQKKEKESVEEEVHRLYYSAVTVWT